MHPWPTVRLWVVLQDRTKLGHCSTQRNKWVILALVTVGFGATGKLIH